MNDNVMPLAMVFIQPQQGLTSVYNPLDALTRGTLFPELDKPFLAYEEGRR